LSQAITKNEEFISQRISAVEGALQAKQAYLRELNQTVADYEAFSAQVGGSRRSFHNSSGQASSKPDGTRGSELTTPKNKPGWTSTRAETPQHQAPTRPNTRPEDAHIA
jgi:hypothetical protein